MDVPIALLQASPLFSGMSGEEIRQLLTCLGAPVRSFGKGTFLWHEGDTLTHCGIVLRGAVDAIHYGDDGEEELVARQRAGAVFGQSRVAAVCAGGGGAVSAAGGDFRQLRKMLRVPRAAAAQSAAEDGRDLLSAAAAHRISRPAESAAADPPIPP